LAICTRHGREYGLQQNDWYDGRRDVFASTKAATTYLKELSETFDGDWLLALASYNCGKGRVKNPLREISISICQLIIGL